MKLQFLPQRRSHKLQNASTIAQLGSSHFGQFISSLVINANFFIWHLSPKVTRRISRFIVVLHVLLQVLRELLYY